MIYKYKGFDKNHKKCSGTIEAISQEEAKAKLSSSKILFTSLALKKEIGLNLDFLLTRKISILELSKFSKNLSIYLRSGISITNAIHLCKGLYEGDRHMLDFLHSIETSLKEGKSFFQALKNQKIFTLPEFFIQSIKISEDNGFLDRVLSELAGYLKNQYKINKQISTAFVYPSFIIFVSIMMISFMLSFVVPKISSMFDSLDQELPGITKFVISAGDFFGAYWLIIFIGFILLMVSFSLLKHFNQNFRYSWEAFLLKMPLLGKIIMYNELARFSYISSIMMDSGVSFVHTVKLSTNIVTSLPIKRVFERSMVKVVEGERLSNSLARDSFTIDKSFIQAISLGEETSELVAILSNISELYFDENEEKTKKFLALLEPMLMLFVGGIVGGIVAAMMLPIVSMNI